MSFVLALIPAVATIAGTGTVIGMVVDAAVAVGLSALSGSLFSKQTSAQQVGGIETTLSTDPERVQSVLLGRAVTAGSLAWATTWGYYGNGDDRRENVVLIEVITLSDMPIGGADGIEALWINAEKATYSAGNPNIPGDTSAVSTNLISYRTYDGWQTTADNMCAAAGAFAENPWYSTAIGRGRAYIRPMAVYEKTAVNKVPQYKFLVRGAPLYDPRQDSTVGGSGSHRFDDLASHQYSHNPILMAYAVFRGLRAPAASGVQHVYGLEDPGVDIWPLDNVFAAANECDRQTERADGSWAAQYVCGGELQLDTEPYSAIEAMLATCGAKWADTGTGVKVVLPSMLATPHLVISDDDLLVTESVKFTVLADDDERVNYVTASYLNLETGDTADAPPLEDAALVAADGRRITRPLDLKWCDDLDQVQRLQKQALQESRRQRKFQFTLPRWALWLEAGHVLAWNSAENGFDYKLFVITDTDETAAFDVLLTIQEIDPDDYDWHPGSEFRPRTDGVYIPVGAIAVDALNFDVEPYIWRGDMGTQRPAILATWLNRDDAEWAEFRIRRLADPDTVVTDRVDVAGMGTSGSAVLLRDLQRATEYQVQMRLGSGAGWEGQWTLWHTVITPSVGYVDFADLSAEMLAAWNGLTADLDQAQADAEQLAADLAAEAQARADAVAAEAQARAAAVTAEAAARQQVAADLAAEAQARVAAVTAEAAARQQVATDLAAEAQSRAAAMTAEAASRQQVATDLAAEVQARAAAVTAEAQSRAAEVLAAEQARAADATAAARALADEAASRARDAAAAAQAGAAALLEARRVDATAREDGYWQTEALRTEIDLSAGIVAATLRTELGVKHGDALAAVSGEQTARIAGDSALGSRIDLVEASLSDKADASALTSLTSEVADQGGQISANAAAIAAVEAALPSGIDLSGYQGLSVRVTEAEDAIDAQAGQISALAGNISGFATTSAVDNLSTRMMAAEGDIEALSSSVQSVAAALPGKADAGAVDTLSAAVAQQGETVSAHTTQLSSLNATIAGLASGEALSGVSVRLTAAEGDIDAQAERIESLETGIGDVRASVRTVQTTDARLTGQIADAALAAATALLAGAEGDAAARQSQSDQSDVLTAHAASITQLAVDLGAEAGVRAGAIDALTVTVTQQGDDLDAQADQITSLQTSVASKADASALTSLGTRVTEVENVNTAQATAITNLQTSVVGKADASAVTALTTRVTATETTNATQADQITSLQATVAGKADASALTSLGTRVTSAENVNTAQATAITNLQTSVAGKADASAVTTLTTRVTATETTNATQADQITSLQTTVAGKADASALTSLGTRVTSAENVNTAQATAITNLQTSVTSKADASAVTALTTRVTATETTNATQADQITSLQTTVAGKADASALTSLGTRVTSAENVNTAQATAITNLQTSVAGKADASAVTALTTRVTETEGDIEAQGDRIASLETGVGDVRASVRTVQTTDVRLTGQIADAALAAAAALLAGAEGDAAARQSQSDQSDVLTAHAASITQLAVDLGAESGVRATAIDALTVTVTQQGDDLDAQADQITSLQTSVASKADASALTSLGTRVTAAENVNTAQATAITNLQTSVAGKADASAVTALTTRVTATETTNAAQADQITSLQTSVAGKADASALTSLSTRVTAAENVNTAQATAITNLQTSVAGKADASAVTALTTRVTETEGDIEAQGDRIASLETGVGDVRASVRTVQTTDVRLTGQIADAALAAAAALLAGAEGDAAARQSQSDQSDVLTAHAASITQLAVDLGAESGVRATAIDALTVTVTQQGDDLDAQADQITSLQTSVASKADASALTSLGTRVTAAENVNTAQATAITNLQTSVAGKADASAVTALTTRVTATETTNAAQADQITSLQTSVAGKADASALTSLSTRVTAAENVNTSQATALTAVTARTNDASAEGRIGTTVSASNGGADAQVQLLVRATGTSGAWKETGLFFETANGGRGGVMADKFAIMSSSGTISAFFDSSGKVGTSYFPNIIADQITTGLIIADEARIGNLVIGTDKIKDNAVADVFAASGYGYIGATGWITVASLTITVSNGSYALLGIAGYGRAHVGDAWFNGEIFVNGTSIGATDGAPQIASRMIYYYPGTYTIEVRINNGYNPSSATAEWWATLHVMRIKK